jgi:hypothetical protein
VVLRAEVRTAAALFRDFFLPLYPEDAKSDLARARSEDVNPGKNPTILANLDDVARVFVAMAPAALGVPDRTLDLDFGDASVHRLSAALTAQRRERLASRGVGADSELFNFVVHGSAYVGACIVRAHGGEWSVRRPLWESVVRLRSRAGEADLPVFHWWLKSIADADEDAPHASLADRYRAYVEIPCARPEDLPIIAPADRALPRLGKVRYDTFHKYLRAHLPELRDVGEHFPSPERFADYGFEHLSFTLVGEGRMLVVHGPTKHGLHAFWFTKEGFEKAAFWPSDPFPAPLLRVRRGHEEHEERVEIVLSRDEKPIALELLWWGP